MSEVVRSRGRKYINCQTCGEDLLRLLTIREDGSVRGPTKYCSPQCRDAKRRKLSLKEIRASSRLRRTRICKQCSKTYIKKHRSTDCGNIFCSRECSFRYLSENKKKKVEASSNAPIKRECQERFAHLSNTEKKIVVYRRSRAEELERRCKFCGDSYSILYPFGHAHKGFCSVECSDAQSKANKLKVKVERKYRTKGGNSVSPLIFILMRREICQLCGQRTPIENRRTHLDNAPEIDHIVPLSKGGKHKLFNLALTCRRCNIKKSNLMPSEYRFSTALYKLVENVSKSM